MRIVIPASLVIVSEGEITMLRRAESDRTQRGRADLSAPYRIPDTTGSSTKLALPGSW